MRKFIVIFMCVLLLCVGCTTVPMHSKNTEIFEVNDSPLLYDVPPLWYQLDPHYRGLPYGYDTIGESGCGLCSAATAISFIEQDNITPLDLYNKYSDSCVVYGVNDMALFCEHFREDYGTVNSEQLWFIDQALEHLAQGHLIFASVEGTLAGAEYGGHIVVLWKDKGDDYYVIDSMQLHPTRMLKDVLVQNDFVYFYAIWKE